MANQQSDKTKTGRTSGPPATAPANQPGTTITPPTGQGAVTAQPAREPQSRNDQPAPRSEDVRSTASGIYDQVKETASGTVDAVATKATTKIEEQKDEVSTGLKTLADTFRKTGSELKSAGEPNQLTDLTAKYSGTAANKIEQIAGYFERKDLKAMMRDAEAFARRNPAIFLGAAFALGVVTARFLKSSPPNRLESPRTNTGTSALPPSANQPTSTLPRPA